MYTAKCQRPSCGWASPEGPGELITVYLRDHLDTVHPQIVPVKAPKLPQPTVKSRIQDDVWDSFCKEWGRFKVASNITENSNVFLLSCCEAVLKENVLRENSDITERDEAEVLRAIKRHAVIEIATSALTTELFSMSQEHSEPVRSFVARVKGKARSCKLVQKCKGCAEVVDFSDSGQGDCVEWAQ